MRTQSSDPELAMLANQLRNIAFEIDDDEREAFFKATSWRHVAFFPDGVTFRIQMYLGGKRRIVGITRNGPAAARFADMARLFFWPYRLRNARPPLEVDMNFSLAQAENDLLTNLEAKKLLEAICNHLMRFGELKQPDGPQVDKRKQREQRRTVRHELAEFLRDIAAESTLREQGYADLRKEVQEAFQAIDQRLTAIDQRLAAIEGFRPAPSFLLPPIQSQPTFPQDESFVWCGSNKIT